MTLNAAKSVIGPLVVLAWIAGSSPVRAQAADDIVGPPSPEVRPAGAQAAATAADENPDGEAAAERDYPRLPLLSRQAIDRGMHVPRALGGSGMLIHNVQDMSSSNLAVAIAKGVDPPDDLVPVPFVTTDRLEGHTSNTEFKADLWLFPFLNLFAGVGKVKGHIDIDVNIDLDAFVPPPICRPARPCGSLRLPFEGKVDNTTMTLGAILAYGSQDWFASLAVAQTLSVSSKDRSDVKTTNAGFRAGPRLKLGERVRLMPYLGANYFDLDASVTGVVRSGPVFPDGDAINLRYSVDLSSQHKWAVINGMNLELDDRWSVQAEYAWGEATDRVLLTASYRL